MVAHRCRRSSNVVNACSFVACGGIIIIIIIIIIIKSERRDNV